MIVTTPNRGQSNDQQRRAVLEETAREFHALENERNALLERLTEIGQELEAKGRHRKGNFRVDKPQRSWKNRCLKNSTQSCSNFK